MTPRKAPGSLAAIALVLTAFGAPGALAGDDPSAPPVPPSPLRDPAMPPAPPQPPAANSLSPLEQLVAPIALYPDPLLAIILPASAAPGDIAAAEVYLVQYGDRTRFDSQGWDPSVRALAHYPEIVRWMSDNPGWTEALGSAFLASPEDVLRAIQSLRSVALSEGRLASSAEQQVVTEGGRIDILPFQSDSIFIPEYDADGLFADAQQGYAVPAYGFGPPCEVGPWLTNGIDWSGGAIFVGEWSSWHGAGGWIPPHFNERRGPHDPHRWHPTRTSAPPRQTWTAGAQPVPRPRPLAAPQAQDARSHGTAVGQAGPGSRGALELPPGDRAQSHRETSAAQPQHQASASQPQSHAQAAESRSAPAPSSASSSSSREASVPGDTRNH
jgi:hypothetical protein